jgi:hypothetical protein
MGPISWCLTFFSLMTCGPAPSFSSPTHISVRSTSLVMRRPPLMITTRRIPPPPKVAPRRIRHPLPKVAPEATFGDGIRGEKDGTELPTMLDLKAAVGDGEGGA